MRRWLRSAGPVEWRDLNQEKITTVLLGASNGLAVPGLVALLKALRVNRLAATLLRVVPLTPGIHLLVRKGRGRPEARLSDVEPAS